MSKQYEDFIDALLRAGSHKIGGGWTCPAHDDKSPSLSVTEGEKGVVFTCHRGCTRPDILKAIGLTMKDTFFQDVEKKERYSVVDTYFYEDESGTVLYKVVRLWDNVEDQKTFRQYRLTNGDWVAGLKDTRRVPYRLPEVLSAHKVYIVEGEKDVETLRSKNVVATTSGGASSWREDYRRYFQGKEVVIIADDDTPGRASARAIFKSLKDICPCQLLRSPTHKDITEHISAGGTFATLVPLSPENDPVPTDIRVYRGRGDDNPLFSKLIFSEEIDTLQEPRYLVPGWIVEGELNVVYGPPGQGKSFFALNWFNCILTGKSFFGKRVERRPTGLYIAAEAANSFKLRKLAWEQNMGVTVPPKAGVWLPQAINLLDPEAVKQLHELVYTLRPSIVVVDTLSQCIPGANENSSEGMTLAVDALQAVCRIEPNPAVLIVHHDTKSTGTMRGHSSLDGAVHLASHVKQEEGVITIKVTKNRADQPARDHEFYIDSVKLVGEGERAGLLLSKSHNSDADDEGSPIETYMFLQHDPSGAGLSAEIIAQMAEKSRSTVNRHLKILHEQNRIVNVGTDRERRWATLRQAERLKHAN